MISLDEAFGSQKDTKEKYDYLAAFCRENSIPLWSGGVNNISTTFNVVAFEKYPQFLISNDDIPNISPQEEWDFFLNRIKMFKPSFFITEMVMPAPNIEHLKVWISFKEFEAYANMVEVPKDDGGFKEFFAKLGDLWSKFSGRSITFKVYAFYDSSQICIEYIYKSHLFSIIGEYKKTAEELEQEEWLRQKREEAKEQEELEEEEVEDLEYQKEQEERNAKIEVLARELSKERKLLLTKNREQREAVTRDFFGKQLTGIDSWDIEVIAKRAIDIFDFEELPALVSERKNQGKTPKQISDELGIGLAKIKKIFAIASTESTPHANRDFLQSMIDGTGKDNGLSNSQRHDTFVMIRDMAEAENDTETLELFKKVAQMIFEGKI